MVKSVLTVLRREEKYVLHMQEAMHYQKQFEQILMTDAFSENGSYSVRSLYFDTADDRDFFDKIMNRISAARFVCVFMRRKTRWQNWN